MSTTIQPATPGPEITGTIAKLETWAMALQIRTPDEYAAATDTLKRVKSSRNQVVEFFADMKASAYRTWKQITARESEFTDKLDAVEKQTKRVLVDYQRRQEEIRLAEERRLQAEADERARREREKLAAAAAKAEAAGKIEKAEALAEQAAEVQAPVITVTTSVPVVAGTSFRTVWSAEITDMDALIKAAADPNSNARLCIQFNQKAADGLARTTKGAVQIPGVTMKSEKSMAVKTE